MSLPLEGIKVIELGNFIAGPFCGMLLGDMGAEVIKVERPKKWRSNPRHATDGQWP